MTIPKFVNSKDDNLKRRPLSPQHKKILEFCNQPRTSKEISEHMAARLDTTHKNLRVLQRLDLLEKIVPEKLTNNQGITFKATGKPMLWVDDYMIYRGTGPMVFGVRL